MTKLVINLRFSARERYLKVGHELSSSNLLLPRLGSSTNWTLDKPLRLETCTNTSDNLHATGPQATISADRPQVS
jgi:hypothetical protein